MEVPSAQPVDQQQTEDLWRANEIFSTLCETLVRQLAGQYRPRLRSPGSVLFHEGAPAQCVFVLLSGSVRVYHRAKDGREILVKLLGAPCVFGDIEVLSDVPFLESVHTLDATLIAEIPAAEYRAFLRTNPEAAWAQLRHASDKFCVAIDNQRRCFDTLEERMATVLLSYCDFYGQARGASILIQHPLSQRDVAQSLAVTLRSVCGVFSRWSRDGIVGKSRGRFLVRRPDVLHHLARTDAPGLAFRMGRSLASLATVPAPSCPTLERLDEQRQTVATYTLSKSVTLGRSLTSDIVVTDLGVADRQCQIALGPTGHRYWLTDGGSGHPTRINDAAVRRVRLNDGDIVMLGSACFRFRSG